MNKVYSRRNWQNEPSIATPLNDVNLNAMDYALDVVDTRVVNIDTTKANQSDLLQTVKSVTYNTTTGVFTFTFWNGTEVTVDLNIEKIPVSFSMSPQGVITMTTADGTEYTADVSELIKTYSFVDSSEIDFSVSTDASGNKNVTASIKAGSITGEKLQPNYLADCVSAKQGAEFAEDNAAQSARDSDLSSQDAEAWAVGERNGQPVPSSDPTYENNAKWWAEHGTGNSFSGLTDTNFTNLQNGQIAKYNSTTHKWVNTEDEGGLLPHFKITSEAGSTVTVVLPDGVTTITPTQTSSGIWQCDVPSYGVYTVHAVINGDDAVRTVTVDTVKEYVIHDEHYSYTLNVYAPTGSSIIVTDGGSETYTGTGAGSTAVVFALHQASTTYTITVTYDGLDSSTTITSSATTGGSGSKTIEFGTINLTLDEDLIGETVVMTNGTATKSKVADSTSMVFYPNATGNWTISCQYEGETYYSEPNPVVVSSLSTAVSAEISLVHIPEGATVTPTDDIQTWLACANITDKSYTTLAEVLADRETFETLIADSNACDYMARSTSWADNITSATGLIPVMTSNTTPSGTASSTNPQTGREAYHALDGDDSTLCNDLGSTNPPIELTYEFPEKVCIKGIRLKYARIATGKIQALDDNNSWVDLVTVTSLSDSTTIQDDYYSLLNNTTSYKKYRVYETASTTSASNAARMMVWSFQLYEDADITHSQDAMALIGKYDYCSNALLGNATWASAIANSDYTFIEPLVPAMTSNTTPSGECIGDFFVEPLYKAFDKNSSTKWYSQYLQGSPDYARIGYHFTTPVIVNKFSFVGNVDAPNLMPTKVQLQGSNDGLIWNNIGDEFTYTTADTVEHTEIVSNTIAYEYYCLRSYPRLYQNNQYYAQYSEIQFYGRASSNVSNTNGIIHTANGDTVTCNGNTYVADTNGIIEIDFSDFDEGTYTFTSGIAKDPTDLSNYYSKSFKITKSPYGGTTELYLMPDAVKTLYWWGYDSGNIENASGIQLGMSYIPYTTNTNSISMAPSSNSFSGVITKNQLSSGKTISTIIETFTGGSDGGISIWYTTTKSARPTAPDLIYNANQNALNTKQKYDYTSSQVGYFSVLTANPKSGAVYALWYE